MNKDAEELLTRGVGEFIDPEGIFRKKLETSPEKIIIKFGVDPTRPDIHLGHAVVLRKLRQFQDLGCKVIFLVGDFTAMIGDPTGKNKIRPEISQDEASNIMKTFVQQIPKILKIEPITGEDKSKEIVRDATGFIVESPWFGWMRNSDWFFNVTDITSIGASRQALTVRNEKGQELDISSDSFLGKAVVFENTRMQKLIQKKQIKTVSLVNFIAYLKLISHSQLVERDMFQERIKKGEPLFMHEMLYPVAQGIDSNLISDIYGSCDLEVGGTDQTFNMLMGRTLMKLNPEKVPQSVLAFKLLEGLDGKEKMSKSLDNYIGITDEPNDMYGKVMSIPDTSIGNYFELCTFTPLDGVEKIRKGLENKSLHPKEVKMSLARQIVEIYHGKEAAKKAEGGFEAAFSKGGIPNDIKTVRATKNTPLAEIFLEHGLVSSKSEFNRLEKEGAIQEIENGVYRVGKHRFIRIEFI